MSSSAAAQSLDIGIVGGGCSGLVALKEFRAEGHRCRVFERSAELGGLYTQVYAEGTFVSSHLLTMFGDFVGRDEAILRQPRMFTFGEYVAYLHDYAEHFQLHEFISYRSEVTKVRRDPSSRRWLLEINGDATNPQQFDRLVVCTGTFGEANLPHFPGEETFRGRVRHLKSVKTFDELRAKSICVVGSGESASDMILAAAKLGSKALLSIRRGHGFLVPRYIHGSQFGPADLDTSRVHHSIPRAWGAVHTAVDMLNSLAKSHLHALLTRAGKTTDEDRIRRRGIWMNLRQLPSTHLWNTFGTKNYNLVEALVNYPEKCQRKGPVRCLKERAVVFEDGSEEVVDEILCCTGFRLTFPFFDRDDAELQRLADEARRAHRLYKHCLHPDFAHDVYFIGFARPALGAVPPLIELQARWCALLASDRLALPARDEMERQIDHYTRSLHRQFPSSLLARLPTLTDYLIYSDDLARSIGCRPHFLRLFFTDPYLWLKLMWGPLLNAHYRLTGPHAQPARARHTIVNAKWVKQPNVLYSLMLLFYSLFWFVFRIESCQPASWYPL